MKRAGPFFSARFSYTWPGLFLSQKHVTPPPPFFFVFRHPVRPLGAARVCVVCVGSLARPCHRRTQTQDLLHSPKRRRMMERNQHQTESASEAGMDDASRRRQSEQRELATSSVVDAVVSDDATVRTSRSTLPSAEMLSRVRTTIPHNKEGAHTTV